MPKGQYVRKKPVELKHDPNVKRGSKVWVEWDDGKRYKCTVFKVGYKIVQARFPKSKDTCDLLPGEYILIRKIKKPNLAVSKAARKSLPKDSPHRGKPFVPEPARYMETPDNALENFVNAMSPGELYEIMRLAAGATWRHLPDNQKVPHGHIAKFVHHGAEHVGVICGNQKDNRTRYRLWPIGSHSKTRVIVDFDKVFVTRDKLGKLVIREGSLKLSGDEKAKLITTHGDFRKEFPVVQDYT